MVDFLESIVDDGKPSVPDSISAALFFVEKLGNVDEFSRISKSPVWAEVVKSIKRDLQVTHGVVRRRAQIPTVALIIALECVVMEVKEAFLWRILAFVRLVKCWACLRFDDVQGICRDSLRLGDFCLQGLLSRTKTTGPGKRTLSVPFYISRSCTLAGVDWMAVGLSLWRDHDLPGQRDFFLPCFSGDGESFVAKMMNYTTASGLNRKLLARMGSPKHGNGGWYLLDELPLAPGDLGRIWTEHSERHWMPVVSAELGEPKERRDFLGRWGIDGHESNSYVLSAKHIICDLQDKAVGYILSGKPGHDEEEVLQQVYEEARKQGFDGVLIKRNHTVLFGDPRLLGRSLHQAPMVIPSSELDEGNEFEAPAAGPEEERPVEKESPIADFWVSISRKGHVRKLHKLFGCGSMKWACAEFEDVFEVVPGVADSYCKSCWPSTGKRAKPPPDYQTLLEASDSESSSSSSSDGPSEVGAV